MEPNSYTTCEPHDSESIQIQTTQPRYRDSLHESRRGGGEGSTAGAQPLQEQPALVAAAFFLATKKLKVCGFRCSASAYRPGH